MEILDEKGNWQMVYYTDKNASRLIRADIKKTTKAVRFIPISTYFAEMFDNIYGSAQAHVFAFEVR